MASGNLSDLCSVCNKLPGKYFCKGCQRHLCSKDLRLHEQKLLEDFDNEIVILHNRLLEEIQALANPINSSSSALFDQIERWKTRTIQCIEKAAEDARTTLTRFINTDRLEIQEQTRSLTDEIRRRRDQEDVLETDIERLKSKITNIQKLIQNFQKENGTMAVVVENNEIDWKEMIYVRANKPAVPSTPPVQAKNPEQQVKNNKEKTSTTSSATAMINQMSNMKIKSAANKIIPNLPVNARWEQQGVTVAGGNGWGGNNNQLNCPYGLFVDDDDDQTIVIADTDKHRIMQWKRGDTQGQVVAGGNGPGNRLNQLDRPTDVFIDKETNSLIIADLGNRRVVRWSRRSGTTQGEILIENIKCYGLAMDEQRNLYVSGGNGVRRYEIDRGDKTGTVVAGGNGRGEGLNQLNQPLYIFVDRNQSLYVSDHENHRVMKWDKGAAQGVVVAGGQGDGSALTQLSLPYGIFVDTLGTLYVAEEGNDRVTRWLQGSERKGTVVVGGNGKGSGANQFKGPVGLSFDKHGNLYVVNFGNHRVQRFNIIK